MKNERPLVKVSTSDGVTTVLLNSAHNRNALSRRLLVELSAALDDTNSDPATHVVVLTAVDPAFCAGADLKEQRDGLGPGPVSLSDVLKKMLRHRCPIVAKINGPVRAGGVGLAAAADITVGLLDATFAFTEVHLGVVPAVIAVPVLSRMQGTAAQEYFLTGETFTGSRAREIGLLNHAVEKDQLDETVDKLVSALRRGGPNALAATKQLRRRIEGQEVEAALEEMLNLSQKHFASPEGQAGIAARLSGESAPWVS